MVTFSQGAAGETKYFSKKVKKKFGTLKKMCTFASPSETEVKHKTKFIDNGACGDIEKNTLSIVV